MYLHPDPTLHAVYLYLYISPNICVRQGLADSQTVVEYQKAKRSIKEALARQSDCGILSQERESAVSCCSSGYEEIER